MARLGGRPLPSAIISDKQIDDGLKHVVAQNRKVMRVIATFFHDVGYRSESALLWGEGNHAPDVLLQRCVMRLKRMQRDGLIVIEGNATKPRFSEVRVRAA